MSYVQWKFGWINLVPGVLRSSMVIDCLGQQLGNYRLLRLLGSGGSERRQRLRSLLFFGRTGRKILLLVNSYVVIGELFHVLSGI